MFFVASLFGPYEMGELSEFPGGCRTDRLYQHRPKAVERIASST